MDASSTFFHYSAIVEVNSVIFAFGLSFLTYAYTSYLYKKKGARGLFGGAG